ncbi:hypothetical protein EVA_04346, partial [gut metagenome]
MFKDVKYNGYSSNPSDYQSADGDLSVALNAIPEDGSIKSIYKPKIIRKLPIGSSVIHVHSTVIFTHYVVLSGNNLSWIDAHTEKDV